MTQILSNISGDPCANKCRVRNYTLYKSTRTWKINLFCTQKVTCTFYDHQCKHL